MANHPNRGKKINMAPALAAEIDRLREINADLLAALIRLRDCPEVQMDETEPETDEARLQANAAIAKATRS